MSLTSPSVASTPSTVQQGNARAQISGLINVPNITDDQRNRIIDAALLQLSAYIAAGNSVTMVSTVAMNAITAAQNQIIQQSGPVNIHASAAMPTDRDSLSGGTLSGYQGLRRAFAFGYQDLNGSSSNASQQMATLKAALSIVDQYPDIAWVKGNLDLLKLGPAAIEILAKAQLTANSYKLLTGDKSTGEEHLGLKPDQAVKLVDRWRRQKKDANKEAERLERSVSEIEDERLRADVKKAIGRCIDNNTNPSTDPEFQELQKRASAKDAEHIREAADILGPAIQENREVTAKAEKKTDVVVKKEDKQASKKDDLLAMAGLSDEVLEGIGSEPKTSPKPDDQKNNASVVQVSNPQTIKSDAGTVKKAAPNPIPSMVC